MHSPSISVIIPTHNRSHLVPRAVRSALAAISPGDEIIVVDDGSTDDTEDALAPFAREVRYIRTAKQGAGPARNRGLVEARHRLIAFLDSDDEFQPDKLRLQRTVMASFPQAVMCFTDFLVRREHAADRHKFLVNWHEDRRDWSDILSPGVPYSSLGPLPSGRPDFLVHVGDLYRQMLTACYVATFTVMIARDRCQADDLRFSGGMAGGFEDWECFARLTRCGPVAYLDCETAHNWGHDGPRLTGDPAVEKVTARLRFMARLWGSDADFMAQHADYYHRAVEATHAERARHLMAEGRMAEARADLALAGRVSVRYRAASYLPRAVARAVIRY